MIDIYSSKNLCFSESAILNRNAQLIDNFLSR